MAEFLNLVGYIFSIAGFLFLLMCCLVGLLLSCLSLSGTWLVVAAAFLTAVLSRAPFPGFGTLMLFVYLAVLVEVGEMVAGYWGVKRRGGSSIAGVMSLIGGLVGLIVGSLLPVPVLGSLAGMLLGSFLLVYFFERQRLDQEAAAAHIAMGAVVARVAVIFMKVVVTLGMAVWLLSGVAKS